MKNFQFAFALFIAFVGSSFTLSNLPSNSKTVLVPDFYLEIDGVKGEARDGGQIEIESFTWGSNQTSVNISRVRTATASPAIQRLAVQGKHIKKAVLHVRKAGSDEYLTYKLKDVLVSSYQTSGSSSRPMESFSLNYAKIE